MFKAIYLVKNLEMRRICRLMEKCAYPQYLDACGIIIQRLFNALAKMNLEKEMKPDPEICEGKFGLRVNLLLKTVICVIRLFIYSSYVYIFLPFPKKHNFRHYFKTFVANKVYIIRLILELEEILTDVNVAAPLRDITIDLLLKNLMHMDGGLPRGWSWRFVEERG